MSACSSRAIPPRIVDISVETGDHDGGMLLGAAADVADQLPIGLARRTSNDAVRMGFQFEASGDARRELQRFSVECRRAQKVKRGS